MQATITGNDPLSKRILLDLDSGTKVAQIPQLYPVSLDQAKKLSRFRRMLGAAKVNLEEEYYHRLYSLGIKSLPLSHLCKKGDWGGLTEILSVVTDETKRDELQLLVQALRDKRERILELKETADVVISGLENEEQLLQGEEKELLQLRDTLNDHIKRFNRYQEPLRSFLGYILGLYQGELILAKKINVDWQQNLRKQGVIEYNSSLGTYFVKDFQGFSKSLKSRHRRGLEYRWDPTKDQNGWKEPHVSDDGIYMFSSALGGSLIESRNRVMHLLNEIKEKKADIQEKLKRRKRLTLQSYISIVETPEPLSTDHLKHYKELQKKALKWLCQRGFVAVGEFALPNGKKADIFAYNESQIIIMQIKVSYDDLVTDQKWVECLPYCHDFYFLTPADLGSVATEKLEGIQGGQFVETEDGMKLIQQDRRNRKKIDQEEELKFSAARWLSRKAIYGY